MADGDNTRIGGNLSPLGPVQRIRQAASRGRARAGADGEGRGDAERGFLLDDPGVRAGPRGGLPDWLGRNVNIYV